MEPNLKITTMEEVLIDEVRKHPSIYNRNTTVYKNNKIREQAWKEVAHAVGLKDREIVKKRWRSLRDSFIKIHRSIINKPNANPGRVKWSYYNRMSFLTPHIEHKEQRRSPSDDEEGDEVQTESNDNKLEYFPEDISFSDVSNSSQSKANVSASASMGKRKRSEDDPLVPGKESDPDEQFLLSCLPALQRLGPRENAIARLRIQKILFDIEFGEDEPEPPVLTKEEIM